MGCTWMCRWHDQMYDDAGMVLEICYCLSEPSKELGGLMSGEATGIGNGIRV
jgi:hypothetical protein